MINMDIVHQFVSINDFMGIPRDYRVYKQITPIEHALNGTYRPKGLVGSVSVQVFEIGTTSSTTIFVARFDGVPTIADGYLRAYNKKDEMELRTLLGYWEGASPLVVAGIL